MWNRLSRAMRSFIGFFISVAENPELILEQNIRDMNDQVPRMNESIAMVKANQTLLEKEEAKYKTEVADLTAKVRAAIQGHRECGIRQGAQRKESIPPREGPENARSHERHPRLPARAVAEEGRRRHGTV